VEHQHDIVIIGSGFGGIGAAVHLKKIGIENFVILERDPQLGGTWWRNSYPGAQVDVQSHLYSFSFELYNWTRLFARQPEILQYTNHVIDKYKIREKGILNATVVKIEYMELSGSWNVTTNDGNIYKAPIVINASGLLSQAAIPDFKGRETFKGKSFHTNLWDHSFDYTNKKVAVIGSGASGVQVIPGIAEKVKQLYAFQRTAHWMIPRPDRILTKFERVALEKFPLINKLFRFLTYCMLESRVFAFQINPRLMYFYKLLALHQLKKYVHDANLRDKLTPQFGFGCKRVLLSNEYYPALTRSNVTLITEGIKEINETGILSSEGQQYDVDLIVYATGFQASENNIPYPVIGRDGISLKEIWKDGSHAYAGTTVPYFPNFFILAGPNTGSGHTSAIYFIESQLKYINETIIAIKKNYWKSVEIKESVENAYNLKIQKLLSKSVWQTGGCKSWYQTASGKNTALYPTFTFLFRKATSNFEPALHLITKI